MKPITAGLALFLAASAVQAAPKSTITKVTATNVGGGVEIAVVGDNLSEPKTFFANSTKTLYVVQFNAALVPNTGKLNVNSAGVGYVKYARYSANPPVARLVIEVTKGITPTVANEDGNWFVRVGVTKPAAAIDGDAIAMKNAITELDKGSFTNNAPVKYDSKSGVFTPGMIVGAEKTASFTEAAFSSTLAPSTTIPAPIGSPFKDTSISLVTDRVDVLTVLKAFAKQTDVNIIVAPNVSPADKPVLLSVSMNDVDLDFAMTSVASLAGLRFTRIGNTYVVCNASDFNSMVGNIWAQSGVKFASRVVDLTSGEAKQIRDATMQALPQDGPDGYYEIFNPTDEARYGSAAGGTNVYSNQGATGTAGAGAAGTAGNAPPTQGSTGSTRAKYVTLVGEPRRLDVIEAFVRDLDKRIAKSFSLSGAANFGSVVVPIMSGQTQKIKDMLGKLLEQNPRKNDYSIEETAVKELAEGDDSQKMLLIAGPKEELETLRIFADNLDASMCELKGIDRNTDPESFKQFYEVVDLKHIEPNHAAFDLKSRIRGLYVSILPDPVTPGLKGEDKDEKAVGGDTGNAGGTGTTAPKTAEMNRSIGHEQMRLVLRGTRAQIDEAKGYLAQVDMPARQVSIELRVMELTRQEALKMGLDWSILTGGRLTSFRMNQGLGGNISQGGTFSGHYQDNSTSSLDVLGQLDAITTKNNLIARPNALITDGRSTHLFVGDTVRYIKLINASQNGTTVEIGEVEVGVTVDVDARIGADGNIALDLAQNFSILTSFTPVPGGGAIPQTSDRNTEMFVNLMSGETIALGGLILEQDRKSVSGIPILKDLPLIGSLFSRTDNRKEKTEIVFFLTAKVVDNQTKSNAANPMRGDGEANKPKGN